MNENPQNLNNLNHEEHDNKSIVKETTYLPSLDETIKKFNMEIQKEFQTLNKSFHYDQILCN